MQFVNEGGGGSKLGHGLLVTLVLLSQMRVAQQHRGSVSLTSQVSLKSNKMGKEKGKAREARGRAAGDAGAQSSPLEFAVPGAQG